MSSSREPQQTNRSARRLTRDEHSSIQGERTRTRYAEERRLQLLGLLALAAAALGGTILYAGPRNIFLPGWWHIW